MLILKKYKNSTDHTHLFKIIDIKYLHVYTCALNTSTIEW